MGDSPLDYYNPLYDVHLRQYFASPHMQKHLRKMGLMAPQQNGDEVYARHHAMMDMMLKNREAQLMKMAELRRKLDAAEKVETCRRIRTGQSPESFRRTKPSRSMSRGRRDSGNTRQRRSSTSFESKDNLVEIETQHAVPESRRGRDAFQRLSANVKRFNYLHKMDDPTLLAYQESLKSQLERLERFREISFGTHSVARAPPVAHGSWFFRRRSLPSLTASAPASTLQEPLRSINNMRTRKLSTGERRADSSRTSCPPPKRRDSHSRLPPIPARSKSKSAATKPPASAPVPRLPPAGNRSRSVQKKETTSSQKKTAVVLPAVAAGGIATAAAVAAITAIRSPSPKELPPVEIETHVSPPVSPKPIHHEEDPVDRHSPEHEPDAFEVEKEPSPPTSPVQSHHEEDVNQHHIEHEETHPAEAFEVPTDDLVENQPSPLASPVRSENDEHPAELVFHEDHHEDEHHGRGKRSVSEDESEPEYAEEDQDEQHEEHPLPPSSPKEPHREEVAEAFEISTEGLVEHHHSPLGSPVRSEHSAQDSHHEEERPAEAFEVSTQELIDQYHEEAPASPVRSEHSYHEAHHEEERPAEAFEVSTEELVDHHHDEVPVQSEHSNNEFYHEEERPAEAFKVSTEELVDHHQSPLPSPVRSEHESRHSDHEEDRPAEAFEVPADELVEHHQSPLASPVRSEEGHKSPEAFEVPADDVASQHSPLDSPVRSEHDHEIQQHHLEHEESVREESVREPEPFEIANDELRRSSLISASENFKHQEEDRPAEAFEVPADELVEHEHSPLASPARSEPHEERRKRSIPESEHDVQSQKAVSPALSDNHKSPEVPVDDHQSPPSSPVRTEHEPEAFAIPADELVDRQSPPVSEHESRPKHHDLAHTYEIPDLNEREPSPPIHHEEEAPHAGTDAFDIPSDLDHGHAEPSPPRSPSSQGHESRHEEDIHAEDFEIPTDVHREPSPPSSPVRSEHPAEAFEVSTEGLIDHGHEDKLPEAFEIPADEHMEEHHHRHSIEIEPVEIAENLSHDEQDSLHHHVVITTTGPTPRPPSEPEEDDKMSTDSMVIHENHDDPMTRSVYNASPAEFEHSYKEDGHHEPEEDRTSEAAWSVKSNHMEHADDRNNNDDDDMRETSHSHSTAKLSQNGNVVHESVMEESEQQQHNVSSL